jgi:hypothetical protein
MYMKSSDGDPNKVLIAYSLIYMLPLSAKIPFNWRDLTPVSVVRDRSVRAVGQCRGTEDGEGIHRRRQGRKLAVQDGRHRLQARGSRADRVHGAEDRREILLSAVQVRRRGGDAAGRQAHRSQRQQPSENLEVWRAGQVRALCVFDKERISYKTKVTETQSWNDIPTCKEEGSTCSI